MRAPRRAAAVAAMAAMVAGMVTGMAVPGAAAGDTGPRLERLAGATRVETAVAVSASTFPSATTAVVARADDPADALAGAPLAASLEAPLLLVPREGVPEGVIDELDRLGVEDVVLLGGTAALPSRLEDRFGSRTVRRLSGEDRIATAIEVARALPASPVVYVAGVAAQVDALAAGAAGARTGRPVLLVGDDASRLQPVLDDMEVTEVRVVGGTAALPDEVAESLGAADRHVTRVAGPDRYATAAQIADDAVDAGADTAHVWLATGRALPDSLAAGPAIAATGGVLLLVDGRDPWSTRVTGDLLRDWRPGRVTVLGGPQAISETVQWQVPVMIDGPVLPRGGATLFPQHRLVALYGHHSSPSLGVLGEQRPEDAVARLEPIASAFDTDGRVPLPTFELIVSLATSGPGPDGDYSAPSSREQIQPWLDAARANGVYLLLDLQPGRTDFLTEAQRYEDLLREPDVGLALDPEWRLGPDQVHLEQVGSVDAKEVNRVSAWLADIVREEGLPQKLFVVHQFQLRMVSNRDQLRVRPELATVIQMDGQGSRAAKLDTYRAVTRGAGPWYHGFKLFYDEDPDLFQPADVLGLSPVPAFVSYQ